MSTDNNFIPIYVVTGFLFSGKTSLINRLLKPRSEVCSILCIQFESGEEELLSDNQNISTLSFNVRDLSDKDGIFSVYKKIYQYIIENNPDEIWVEWNGVTPIATFQNIIESYDGDEIYSLKSICKIKKIITVIDAETFSEMLTNTGGMVIDNISNCDIVVVRNIKDKAKLLRIKKTLRVFNKNIKVLNSHSSEVINENINSKNINPYGRFIFWLYVIILAILSCFVFFGKENADLAINIFIGIILQAVPFLLIGILLSSAIQVFVPIEFIQKHYPKNRVLGVLFGAFAGFFLPVCDCASVPVFRSLVKKGVPLSSAVTFMMATPVINPVVILSTWFAFGGSISMVLCRVLLGIVCSVIIGLTFSGKKETEVKNSDDVPLITCTCGCCTNTTATGAKAKFIQFITHAQSDFFDVGKYLVLGAGISSVIQIMCKNLSFTSSSGNLLGSIIVMMTMAFLMSLCSSSDAVVAKSFVNQFPLGGIMGFLVFGPMIDIKNIIMLGSSFSKKFVIRLCVTTALVCLVAVYIVFSFGIERFLV